MIDQLAKTLSVLAASPLGEFAHPDAGAQEAPALRPIDIAHQALLAGDLPAWRHALGEPADFPHTRDPCGETCLETAILHAPATLVAELIALGADVNYADDAGFPSLFAAIDRQGPGRLDVVRMLLAAGVDVQQRGVNDYSALHYAAARNDPLLVELLLEHGADHTARTRIDHYATPLEEAERHGYALSAAAIRDWVAR